MLLLTHAHTHASNTHTNTNTINTQYVFTLVLPPEKQKGFCLTYAAVYGACGRMPSKWYAKGSAVACLVSSTLRALKNRKASA